MPPPNQSRKASQPTPPANGRTTRSAVKRKRAVSSAPASDEQPQSDSSENDRVSDDDFDVRVAKAIGSPTPSGDDNQDESPSGEVEEDLTDDLTGGNDHDGFSLSHEKEESTSISL